LVCGYPFGGCWLVYRRGGGWLVGGACGATAAETDALAVWGGAGVAAAAHYSNWAFVHASGEL